MDAKYIAAAVPVFFLLMGLELWRGRGRGDPLYVFEDSLANLGCGVWSQVVDAFFRLLPLFVYTLIYERWRLLDQSPRSPLAWVALLFLVDLAYYAYHRASHRVGFMWAGHSIHHQSEEYNLSVALRQGFTQDMMSWVFYLPLAVLGFPPGMYLLMHTLNTLYQFWIHTRLVGRLGPLEWVLNTPSHHRVHHGIDPKYIDKNYAGIFILWDRLFQTFIPEAEEPVYGTVTPLSSWNVGWAHLSPWVYLYGLSRRTRRLRDKVLLWIMPPEWRPADLGGRVIIPEVSRTGPRRYARRAPRGVIGYVAVNFVLALLGTSAFLLVQEQVGLPLLGAIGAAIMLTFACVGGLLEGRDWAWPVEVARLGLVLVLGLGLAWRAHSASGAALAVLVAGGLTAWALRSRHRGLLA